MAAEAGTSAPSQPSPELPHPDLDTSLAMFFTVSRTKLKYGAPCWKIKNFKIVIEHEEPHGALLIMGSSVTHGSQAHKPVPTPSPCSPLCFPSQSDKPSPHPCRLSRSGGKGGGQEVSTTPGPCGRPDEILHKGRPARRLGFFPLDRKIAQSLSPVTNRSMITSL